MRDDLVTGIDHVVIGVGDLGPAIRAYEMLLGREASAVSESDGVATALIVLDDIAVELMAPVGDGEQARRLRAAIDDGGEGLKSLVFSVTDVARMHRRAERVGLAPESVVERENAGARWRSFRASRERTSGARLFFIERAAPLTPASPAPDGLASRDHIVVRTADPTRAAALYGARLGLDMRLDREIAGRRLMFFRCGAAIVEIVEDAAIGASDRLWGLSWRVRNADAARARLADAGVDVSGVRDGMKPGTRVFTVRDRTCGVPTLMIEQSSNRD